jgi:type II secretory pathway pseudopilin PulG
MTLIELILVLGLLGFLFAASAPSLRRFMKGRSLAEESRRALSLARFARQEAVSRGIPMEFWIHPEEGALGVAPQLGFEEEDEREWRFELDSSVHLEVDGEKLDESGKAVLRYLPDGLIDPTSGLESFRINDEDGGVEIRRSETGPLLEAGPMEKRLE